MCNVYNTYLNNPTQPRSDRDSFYSELNCPRQKNPISPVYGMTSRTLKTRKNPPCGVFVGHIFRPSNHPCLAYSCRPEIVSKRWIIYVLKHLYAFAILLSCRLSPFFIIADNPFSVLLFRFPPSKLLIFI